jgi:hypothetical protein
VADANHGSSKGNLHHRVAAVTGPALAAEQAIAREQELDRDSLAVRYAAISERYRRQIWPRRT